MMRTMAIRPYGLSTPSANMPLPTFGYSVELRLALAIQKVAQSVGAFDRGKVYDQRRCNFNIQATEQQVAALKNVLERERRNIHGEKFVLTLTSGSGFFPAGADKGDGGEFTFSFLENINFSAMKLSPYGFFDISFRILIHDAPTIPVPQAAKDLSGHFKFGTITGIRDPQISPKQDFGVSRSVTVGGEAHTVATPTDELRTDLTITTTTGKMAELANYLQNTARGGLFTVTPGSKYWLWGGQDSEYGLEAVRLLSGNFLMTHADYDLWTVPVQLWRVVAVVTPAPLPTYSMTITRGGAGSGTISVNGVVQPGGTSVTQHLSGDIVSLSAVPDSGSTFLTWYHVPAPNQYIGYSTPNINITVTANTTLIVNFGAA